MANWLAAIPGLLRKPYPVARCLLGAALLAGGLAACSTADELLDQVTGDKQEILAGKREPILRSGALNSNQSVASDPIAIPAAVTNASWAQPGGVPSHALHNLTLSRELKQAFSVDAGAGSDSDGRLTASPIVLGGRVYVLDAHATVRAFNAQSGGAIWQKSLVPAGKDEEGAYGGGLASDGARIYATTAFGEAVALDAGSGAEIWRRKFELPIRAAPTVANGRLFFTTVSNEVHALSTHDGSQVWRYQGSGETASIITSTSPAVANGIVVVPYTTGDLVAINADSGFLAWTETLSGSDSTSSLGTLNDIAGRPVIEGGAVYAIAHAGRMASFNLQDGSEIWSQDLSGTQTPWVAGDYVFIIAGRDRIAAVARRNGGVRWWAKLPSGGIWSGPVLGGGRLLTVSSKGLAVSISPQSGQTISTTDLGEEFFIAPVIANGTVYLLSDDATLIAMR